MKKTLMIALAALSCAAISQATEVLRLPGSTDLSDANYWDGGVPPGSSDVALFDGTTVPDTNSVTYSGGNVYYGGYKFTDINGPISFSMITYLDVDPPSGIILTNTHADVHFSYIRSNKGGSFPITVASNCTVRIDTLNGRYNTYTLPISGGGTVLVNGYAGGGARMFFDVSGAGTTIGGTGTWAASLVNTTYGMQIGTGSCIAPGDNGVGTVTIDGSGGATALSLADGSVLKFELGTGGNGFALPSSDSDQIVLTSMSSNDVVFQGTTTIDFQGTGSNGVYKLLDTDMDTATWSGLTVSNEVFNWSGNLVTNKVITSGLAITNLPIGLPPAELIMGDGVNGDPGDIYLVVGALDLPYTPKNVTWTAGTGTWDINSSLNWSNSAGPAVYYEKDGVGDNVTFDDSGLGGNIGLNTNVYPSAMTVNNSAVDYTFSGTGSINGNIVLNKTGSGTLTLSMANNYIGGTTIAGGTINYTDGGAFGTGTITFEGGTLQSGANYADFNNELFVDAGQTGSLIMSDRCTINAAPSGAGTLNVTAPSTLGGTRDYLSAPCAGFNGTLNISGGARLDLLANGGSFDANLSGATVNIDNETLYSRNWSYGLTIQLGALSGTSNAVLAGSSNDAGATTWEVGAKNLDTEYAGSIMNGDYNVTALTKVGTGTLTVSGTNNTYTGATTVNDGTLIVSGSVASPATVNGGTLQVSGSVTNDITVNGGTLDIGTTASISNVTVNSGGTIVGGNTAYSSGPGTVGGDLTLNDGAQIVVNTNGIDSLWVSGSLNVTNTFGANNVLAPGNDWSSVSNGTYILLWGYTNTISGIDTSDYYLGGGHSAHLVDGGGDIEIVIGTAAPVPSIGSVSVSNGAVTLSWSSGSYNVYTNSDLTNTNGWGVATNADTAVSIPIGSETNLFYKLGY